MAVINLGNGNDLWDAFSVNLGNQDNQVNGNGGNDFIVSGYGNDTVNGGEGNDLLYGVDGNDVLNGGEGDDAIDSGTGTDTMSGGAGNDTYMLDFSTDIGIDSINDDNGILQVGFTEFDINTGEYEIISYQIAGTPTATGTPNIYQLIVKDRNNNDVIYNIEWNGVAGSDLTIWGSTLPRNLNSTIIKNFNDHTFGLNFTAVNTAPVAANDSSNVGEGRSVIIDVTANDTDSDGTINKTTVVIVTPPSHGTISVDAVTGKVTYTANDGYVGADTFIYNVKDNNGTVSNNASVSLNVTDNTINLTSGNDVWVAAAHGLSNTPNEVNGLGGNDIIEGGSQADIIDGGAGTDMLFGLAGDDVITGGEGSEIDRIDAGSGNNTVSGGAGNDSYVVQFSNTGTTTITDDAGLVWAGTINTAINAVNGTPLSGIANETSNGKYLLVVGANQYELSWAGAGSDLTIKQLNGNNPHTVVIKNFVNNTYTLQLIDTNFAPTAGNDTAVAVEDRFVVVNVLANDSDSDGSLNAGSVTIVGQPAHGAVSVNATTGAITYTPAAGYVGADSFTYTVLDNQGAISNTATVNVTVTDSAAFLTENDDFFEPNSTGQGGFKHDIHALGGNDFIIGGSQADIIDGGEGNDVLAGSSGDDTLIGGSGNDILWGGANNNTLTGGTGDDRYVANFTQAGTTQIVDGNGKLFSGTLAWDNPPAASNVTITGAELTGEAEKQPNGKYLLTIGAEQFELTWDGTGSDLTIVRISGEAANNKHTFVVKSFTNGTFGLNLVLPNIGPDAANDNATVVENKSVLINVLGNDLDSDGTVDATSVTIVDQPAHGTVSVNATTGVITYTPTANYVGSDTFTYTILDNDGAVSNVATVTINVTDSAIYLTEENDRWSAHQNGFGNTNNEIYALNGNDLVSGGSANDYIEGDAGNDALFGSSGDDTLKGEEGNDIMDGSNGNNIVEGGEGDDIYVVEFQDTGSTQIIDDNGKIYIGTVNQTTFAPQGVEFAGEAVRQPSGKYLLTIGTEQFELTWNGEGSDLSIVKITGNADTKLHTVVVKSFVNGTFGLDLVLPNNAPDAEDDSATVVENKTVVIDLLANDGDSDGTVDATSVTIVDQPAHGTIAVDALTGKVTYTPAANYVGSDTFTYTVKDNDGAVSEPATVTVNVTDSAIYLTEENDRWSAHQNGFGNTNNEIYALNGNDLVSGGSANDYIEGDAGNDALFGSSGDDTLKGEQGNDIMDGSNGNNIVEGGEGDDIYVVEFQDTGLTQIVDTDGSIYIGTVNQTTFAPQGVEFTGEAVKQPNGKYLLTIGAEQYELTWNGAGSDLSIVKLTGAADTKLHTVVVKSFVNGTFGLDLVVPNEVPVAGNDETSVKENQSIVINITGNDVDSDGAVDKTSVTIVTQPAHGTIIVDPITGNVTYTPAANYVGSDTFTYTVKDNDGAVSEPATVTINVTDSAIYLTENTDFFEANSLGLGSENLELYALNGNDIVITGSGNDYVEGDAGNDTLFSWTGDDVIKGEEGNDILDAGAGNNTAEGGEGDDTFIIGFNNSGSTQIVDTDGKIISGILNQQTAQPQGVELTGEAVQQSGGKYLLTVGTEQFELTWNGEGSDLTIKKLGGNNPHITTVKTFVNGTFGLNLVAPNAAPEASNDDETVKENKSVVIDVLGNDNDPDGQLDLSSVTIVTQPAHGTVTIDTVTGEITYTPAADYVGTDTFTYTVKDNDGAVSEPATVTIEVESGAIYLTENPDFFEAFSLGLGNENLELYALDSNDVVVTGFGNDYIEGDEGNDVIFSYNGNDTIKGDEGDDILDAGAGENLAEGGEGEDTFIIGFNNAGSTQIVDTDGKIYSGVLDQQTLQPQGTELEGDAVKQANGKYLLIIAGEQFELTWNGVDGTDLVITKVGGTNPHVVTVQSFVNGTFGLNLVLPNVAPVAVNDSVNTTENTEIVIDVLGNDSDTDGEIDLTSVTIVTQPAHGTVTVNAETGEVTYTPADGYFGSDSFTYTIVDNDGAISDPATVNINITETEEPTEPEVEVDPNGIILTENVDFYEAVAGSTTAIYALESDDVVIGNDVNDTIYGMAGNDTLNGGLGNDKLYGGGGNDALFGAEGDDYIEGNGGNDDIDTGEGNDIVNAGSGDDLIWGGAGNDIIDGDTGNDTVTYRYSNTAVNVNLSENTASGGDAEGDVLSNIENVRGSVHNDTIVGNSLGNFLFGEAGDDLIVGGLGQDQLFGGEGADTFRFDSLTDSLASVRDSIKDFAVGVDKISFASDVAASFSDLIIQIDNGGVNISVADSEFSLHIDNVYALTESDFLFS